VPELNIIGNNNLLRLLDYVPSPINDDSAEHALKLLFSGTFPRLQSATFPVIRHAAV
jgi:hypothetical protein